MFNDIGTPGLVGSASYSSGEFTIEGSGADIWGSADQFAYVHQGVTDGSTISARITSQTNTNTWAKSGLMFRETLDANSKFVDLVVSPGKGLNMQWRDTTGGTCGTLALESSITLPVYIKLERSGDTFNAYKSTDGSNWGSVLGSHTLAMNSTVKVGMCV